MTVFVYAISSSQQPAPVKIGKTKDVAKRLRQLQTSSPVRLQVWWQRETNDPALESKLHRHFGAQRATGEWFNFQRSDWPAEVERAAAILEADVSAGPPGISGGHLPVTSQSQRAEAKLTWHAHAALSGLPDWAPDEAGIGDRCLCGHRASQHAGPYSCAGLDPRWNRHYECECTAFRSDAPWSLDAWRADGIASGCLQCQATQQV
ncbi:GIY-YIG nuclease family protein [Streptomyces sp. NPDC006656]|uniref:GIY-YIG nuclease family protein n=1 Tax=Streptomyces sp. NPDC006656 TaxID=3156899 RepID=UPI00345431B6